MNFEDYYYENSKDFVTIEEGIRFFKTSKKIDKLINRAKKKLENFERKVDKNAEKKVKEIKDKIEQLEKLLPQFKELEEKYKKADSKEQKKNIKEERKKIAKANKKVLRDGTLMIALTLGLSIVSVLAIFAGFISVGSGAMAAKEIFSSLGLGSINNFISQYKNEISVFRKIGLAAGLGSAGISAKRKIEANLDDLGEQT